MNIARGADWGEPAPLPDDAVEVAGDAELAELVGAAFRAGRPSPPVALVGGDLARTLGGRTDRRRFDTDRAARFEVDIGVALLDGRRRWFAAHLVAHRRWWRGRALVVANAAFRGPENLAPRAHPGDGRLDVLEAELPRGQRRAARRRLRTGTHVPHPAIRQRRITAATWRLDPGTVVSVDGTRWGTGTELAVRIEPAAVTVWV